MRYRSFQTTISKLSQKRISKLFKGPVLKLVEDKISNFSSHSWTYMSLQFLDEQKCCQETGCNIHLSCTILGQDLCCRLSTSKSAASRIGEMMILPTKFLASASWQVLKSRSEHCCALCCRNSHHCSHFRQAYFMLPKWVQSSFSFPYSSLLYKGIL